MSARSRPRQLGPVNASRRNGTTASRVTDVNNRRRERVDLSGALPPNGSLRPPSGVIGAQANARNEAVHSYSRNAPYPVRLPRAAKSPPRDRKLAVPCSHEREGRWVSGQRNQTGVEDRC